MATPGFHRSALARSSCAGSSMLVLTVANYCQGYGDVHQHPFAHSSCGNRFVYEFLLCAAVLQDVPQPGAQRHAC